MKGIVSPQFSAPKESFGDVSLRAFVRDSAKRLEFTASLLMSRVSRRACYSLPLFHFVRPWSKTTSEPGISVVRAEESGPERPVHPEGLTLEEVQVALPDPGKGCAPPDPEFIPLDHPPNVQVQMSSRGQDDRVSYGSCPSVPVRRGGLIISHEESGGDPGRCHGRTPTSATT